MRFFQKTLLAFMLLLGSRAQAFTPESGFWWNPNEPGSGYSIEIQDNFLFIALYVYDEFGNPIWYSAGTTLEGNAVFDSSLNYTYNGTCIDCSYTAPITIVGDRGPITIIFETETTATIQFEGAIKNIERFNFLLGDEADRMLGEWQTVIDFSSTGVSKPYIGDVLLFDNTFINNSIKFVEGCRPENTDKGFCTIAAFNNHNITAHYDFDSELLLVRVEDGLTNGVNLIFDYYLQVGLDQFDGSVEVHEEGLFTNIFYPVRGFRTASRSFVETGTGPSKNKSNVNKEGFFSMLDIELPSKLLSDYSLEEQIKIKKRHELFDKNFVSKRKR